MIIDWLFSEPDSPKLWEVENHRVKEIEVPVRGTGYRGKGGRTETRYKCVDCHKRQKLREQFSDECCYEVINS